MKTEPYTEIEIETVKKKLPKKLVLIITELAKKHYQNKFNRKNFIRAMVISETRISSQDFAELFWNLEKQQFKN